MTAYESNGFDPPAPLAYVRVVGIYGKSIVNVPLLIDSGADVTLVPSSVAQFVGATPERAIELESYDGATRRAEVVQLTVGILGYRFQGAYVVMDVERGLLGRDILNQLAVLLDGPRLSWSVQR